MLSLGVNRGQTLGMIKELIWGMLVASIIIAIYFLITPMFTNYLIQLVGIFSSTFILTVVFGKHHLLVQKFAVIGILGVLLIPEERIRTSFELVLIVTIGCVCALCAMLIFHSPSAIVKLENEILQASHDVTECISLQSIVFLSINQEECSQYQLKLHQMIKALEVRMDGMWQLFEDSKHEFVANELLTSLKRRLNLLELLLEGVISQKHGMREEFLANDQPPSKRDIETYMNLSITNAVQAITAALIYVSDGEQQQVPVEAKLLQLDRGHIIEVNNALYELSSDYLEARRMFLW